MSTRGKHASDDAGAFYRDLIIMILGILLVGAAVFLILFLIADGPEAGPTTFAAADSTTSTSTGEATTTTTTTEQTTTTTTAPSTTTTVPVRTPSEVRVVVLNSVGIDGAAGRLTTRLDEAGYQTLAPDDYEPEQDPSRIWYREGFSAEANVLLDFLPEAVVESLPEESLAEGADVVLVLGTGYEE